MSFASARFTSTLLTAIVGAVLGVGAFSLSAPTERWLAFGGGCAVLVVVALAFLMPRRGALQRALDLPSVLIGVWLIVASRAVESGGAGSSPDAVKWLTLASGAALCGAGLVGLLLHEMGLERDLGRVADDSWTITAIRAREDESSPKPLMIADPDQDALSRTAG
ncbi:MAG TPA: hypothetical protein VHU61_08200 [Solirubrobacteraceae bacterium]|jgi:hypothetical protein|nr:hypothetical protein [Solirubrobacteraceae bacterium]